ncbi:hypothetical protein E2C01_061117 [Portunus trituberculatus]|uniref:Uncharacterized protein n=1 Tax=Portunus trituberculatus TaxID=210409 RepID=A0A5B7HDH8_PORTR|nr:hypothetical protein [Portunus trituberculatus]
MRTRPAPRRQFGALTAPDRPDSYCGLSGQKAVRQAGEGKVNHANSITVFRQFVGRSSRLAGSGPPPPRHKGQSSVPRKAAIGR